MATANLPFDLHPQLQQDTFFVIDLALCRVLLMDNVLFPWLVLVPRIGGVREIIDLDHEQRHGLMDEISSVSTLLQTQTKAEKLNIAALGNYVSQLHIHIIARFARDAVWPAPVWGRAHEPYRDPGPMLAKLKTSFTKA